MNTIANEDKIFEFGELFKTGELCANNNYEPFDVRKTLALVKELGRPLSEKEMQQFNV